MPITFTQIEKLESSFGLLYSRMDADKDRYFLKSYQLKGSDNKPLKRVVNVTLNDPATFAHYIIGALMSAREQITVLSKVLKDDDTTYIEDLLKDLHTEIDVYLSKRGLANSHWYNCEQICLRGRVVRRNLMRVDPKVGFVPDVVPVDARYFAYELGQSGIQWCVAQFNRTKEAIFNEYGVTINGDSAIVRDAWDDKNEYIYIDQKLFKTNKNLNGYPPFVMTIAPAGSRFNDTDAFEKTGESIFWMARDVWDEENRTASILQTQNMLTIRPPRQYKSERGERGMLPDGDISGIGAEVAVEKNGGYDLIPQGDAKNATQFIMNILSQARQRGSLANIDYGSVNQTMSAVAIKTLMMHQDLVTNPRIQALQMFNQECDKMMIKQLIAIGGSISLGEEGMKTDYDTGKLAANNYTVKYEYTSQNPVGEIANWSVAQVADPFLAAETILRDIIKRENPTADMNLKRKERAEKMDPAIAMLETVRSLVKMDDQLGGEVLLRALEALLQTRNGPTSAPTAGPETNTAAPPPAGKTLIPLLNNQTAQIGLPKGA